MKFMLLGCSGAWSRAWTKLLLRQTNSCLMQGRGHLVREGEGTPLFFHTLLFTPTPRCHFTSDLIHSLHPSFMLALTSFPRGHPSFGRRFCITAETKLPENEFRLLFSAFSLYSEQWIHFLFSLWMWVLVVSPHNVDKKRLLNVTWPS